MLVMTSPRGLNPSFLVTFFFVCPPFLLFLSNLFICLVFHLHGGGKKEKRKDKIGTLP